MTPSAHTSRSGVDLPDGQLRADDLGDILIITLHNPEEDTHSEAWLMGDTVALEAYE